MPNDLAASWNVWHVSVPEEHKGDYSVLDLHRSVPNQRSFPTHTKATTHLVICHGTKEWPHMSNVSPAILSRSIMYRFRENNNNVCVWVWQKQREKSFIVIASQLLLHRKLWGKCHLFFPLPQISSDFGNLGPFIINHPKKSNDLAALTSLQMCFWQNVWQSLQLIEKREQGSHNYLWIDRPW